MFKCRLTKGESNSVEALLGLRILHAKVAKSFPFLVELQPNHTCASERLKLERSVKNELREKRVANAAKLTLLK
jgi:hypothetical protein